MNVTFGCGSDGHSADGIVSTRLFPAWSSARAAGSPRELAVDEVRAGIEHQAAEVFARAAARVTRHATALGEDREHARVENDTFVGIGAGAPSVTLTSAIVTVPAPTGDDWHHE